MDSKPTPNNFPDSKRYQIRYRVDSFSLHESDSGERSVVITAGTEQSAVNRFNQMYHNCFLIDIQEKKDES